LTKPRILVIDDEAAIRDSLKMILEYEDYQFIGAASGQDGLTAVQARAPDAVLLDIKMPAWTAWRSCASCTRSTRACR
jgi:CheY-like chemotaxis protein